MDIRDLVRALVETSHKVEHLQSFLHDMREADSLSSQRRRNHEKILDALKFPGIHFRQERVTEAAGYTFAWLIENETIPDELYPSLEISLRQWLATGNGVFHITGKPGSGKSTFMKLIDKSKVADLQLQKWVVGDHKRLIKASCYLWKAAEANCLQNELEGLTRTLLFHILQQEPGLTSALFKTHPCWNPENFTLINCVTNSHSTAVTLQPEEILEALESVLAISAHHFFLLIDGLDELKNTREHEHKKIAERILRWGTHNSGNVKICVSSREDRAFIETFPGKQRLQLHAVTGEDIKTLVDLRVKKHGYLTSEEREVLAAKIAKQARGVFLWVVLALGNLMPLFNAKQGIQRLKHHVRALPEEMNDFLAETLKRIPECYRKEAWAVFTVRASLDPDHELVFHTTNCLIYYSMLEKCLDSNRWRIDEHQESMGAEDVAHQVQDFASRFPELSSGLLEIDDSSFIQTASIPPAWKFGIFFTHRSVYDFLQDHPDKLSKALAIPEEIQKLSGPELLMRSTIQVVNDFPLKQLAKDPTDTIWFCLFSSISKFLDSNPVFPLMKILEEALLRKQRVILHDKRFNGTKWTDLRLGPHTASVFHRFLTSGYFYRYYVDWAQEKGNYPSWIRSKEFKIWTVERVFHDCCGSNGNLDCHLKAPGLFTFSDHHIVNFHEKRWLSYNDLIEPNHSLIPAFSPILRGTLWLHLLIALLVSDRDVICDDFAKHYINISKNGMDLDVQFEWWSECQSPERSSSVARISADDADLLAETRKRTRLGLDYEPENKAQHPATNLSGTQNALSENNAEFESEDKSEKDLRGEAQSESDILRGWIRKQKSRGAFPPEACFGMTVKMGGDEEPQLIQGPQWTDIQDNELLPKFVAIFKKSAGITTLKDLLKMWVSKVLEEQHSRHLFEKWAAEVRDGRKDLWTADRELRDDLNRKRKECSSEMRHMSNRFSELYEIIAILEASSSPILPKGLSSDARHNRDEDVKKPDDHERRQALSDLDIDVLKDKVPSLRKVFHDWSTIMLLCLGE